MTSPLTSLIIGEQSSHKRFGPFGCKSVNAGTRIPKLKPITVKPNIPDEEKR